MRRRRWPSHLPASSRGREVDKAREMGADRPRRLLDVAACCCVLVGAEWPRAVLVFAGGPHDRPGGRQKRSASADCLREKWQSEAGVDELRERLFRQPSVEQSSSTTINTPQRRAEGGVGCRPALPAGAMTVALACRLLHVASESRCVVPLCACEWPAPAARTPMAMPGSCRSTPPPDALRAAWRLSPAARPLTNTSRAVSAQRRRA